VKGEMLHHVPLNPNQRGDVTTKPLLFAAPMKSQLHTSRSGPAVQSGTSGGLRSSPCPGVRAGCSGLSPSGSGNLRGRGWHSLPGEPSPRLRCPPGEEAFPLSRCCGYVENGPWKLWKLRGQNDRQTGKSGGSVPWCSPVVGEPLFSTDSRTRLKSAPLRHLPKQIPFEVSRGSVTSCRTTVPFPVDGILRLCLREKLSIWWRYVSVVFAEYVDRENHLCDGV